METASCLETQYGAPSLLGLVAPFSPALSMALDITALYRRYGDLVLGRCRTLLGNDDDAMEMAQEIFLRLHRYQDRFRGDAAPSTYLFHVTTTTCLNHLRTRRRRREDFIAPPPREVGTDTLLDTIQLRDLLDRVLADADDTTRACVIYHHADGMTHDEVGALVGLSGAAVRKRIATFRRSLAEDPPAWLCELEEAP
jgi:RNA polymerase sigma-70 factor (ECF subfamily)